jgi:hypothetical protein
MSLTIRAATDSIVRFISSSIRSESLLASHLQEIKILAEQQPSHSFAFRVRRDRWFAFFACFPQY